MARLSLVFRRPGSTTRMKGLAELQAKIAKLGPEIVAEVQASLQESADALVGEMKAIAPVAPEFEHRAGELRDSIHKGPGRHELAAQVIIDAKDAHGHYYAAHVEFGHKDKGGGHVAAKPFVYPTLRRMGPKLKRKTASAMSKAVKRAFT